MIAYRLRRECQFEIQFGPPQVAYRETITKTIEHDYTHKKVGSPFGQFARVVVRFEPVPAGNGFVFENQAAENSVPSEYLPGVERGLLAARDKGAIAGFPMIDLKATLVDGAHHDIESSIMAFEFAARACFREAMPKAGPKLLEPMMKVEVGTPEEFLGDVIGDLNRRRGQVLGMKEHRDAQTITAMVPLANLFGYVNDLMKMCQGRAQHTMQFDHYEQVPMAVPDPGNFPGAIALREGARLA